MGILDTVLWTSLQANQPLMQTIWSNTFNPCSVIHGHLEVGHSSCPKVGFNTFWCKQRIQNAILLQNKWCRWMDWGLLSIWGKFQPSSIWRKYSAYNPAHDVCLHTSIMSSLVFFVPALYTLFRMLPALYKAGDIWVHIITLQNQHATKMAWIAVRWDGIHVPQFPYLYREWDITNWVGSHIN